MRVKICGLRRVEDVEVCLDAGVDDLGFILARRSDRVLSRDMARRLVDLVNGRARTVAVVDLGEDDVEGLIRAGFDRVQVHGGPDPDAPRSVQIPVYAVSARAPDGLKDPGLKLFDSAVGGRSGGTGVRFDPGLLRGAMGEFYVAGGLGEQDVDAARSVGAVGMDVSSAVESGPGIKDAEKIRRLVNKVRSRS